MPSSTINHTVCQNTHTSPTPPTPKHKSAYDHFFFFKSKVKVKKNTQNINICLYLNQFFNQWHKCCTAMLLLYRAGNPQCLWCCHRQHNNAVFISSKLYHIFIISVQCLELWCKKYFHLSAIALVCLKVSFSIHCPKVFWWFHVLHIWKHVFRFCLNSPFNSTPLDSNSRRDRSHINMDRWTQQLSESF